MRWLIALAASIAGVTLVVGLSRTETIARKPVTTAIATTPAPVLPATSPLAPAPFPGVIVAAKSAVIAAPSAGRVTEVAVRVGAIVRARDVLARMESTSLSEFDVRAAVQAARTAEAERDRARIVLQQSRTRLERMNQLRLQELASAQQLEDAGYDVDAAIAALTAMESALAERLLAVEKERAMLESLTLRAPFGGVVADVRTSIGTTESSGAELFRIVQADPPRVRFAVSIAAGQSLAHGRRLRVHVKEMNLWLYANVTGRAPEIDPSTLSQTYEALLEGDTPTGSTLVGRLAEVYASDARPEPPRD